jgi:hypothetical protein
MACLWPVWVTKYRVPFTPQVKPNLIAEGDESMCDNGVAIHDIDHRSLVLFSPAGCSLS